MRAHKALSGTRLQSVLLCGLGVWGALWGTACDAGSSDVPRAPDPARTAAVGQARPEIGAPAPVFTLVDLQGAQRTLSEYRGKVVLLNFWATWCGPCLIEMPGMETLYRDLKTEGLEILAVSSDPEGRAVTQPFAASNGLTFPVLDDADYRVSGRYGVRTLPMSFLIDRAGTLTHRVFGSRDWNSPEARALMRGLLRAS